MQSKLIRPQHGYIPSLKVIILKLRNAKLCADRKVYVTLYYKLYNSNLFAETPFLYVVSHVFSQKAIQSHHCKHAFDRNAVLVLEFVGNALNWL